MDKTTKKGCISFGANNRPQIDVKTASAITLGFKREKKSVTELSETSKSTLFLIASDFTNLLHNQRLKNMTI